MWKSTGPFAMKLGSLLVLCSNFENFDAMGSRAAWNFKLGIFLHVF